MPADGLKAREDRVFAAALAETTQSLVCVYDRDGRIVRFNRACERATGYAREEVLGRDAREVVIPPEEAGEFGPFLAEIWSTGRSSPREGHWLTRDGARRTISWANEPVRGADGEIEYLVTAGRDITEREEKAAKLRRLVDEQAALRRVATLVASDPDPGHVFQAVTEEACRLLDIPSVVLERFEDDGTTTVVGRFSGTPADGFEAAPTLAVPVVVAGRRWGALIAEVGEGESLPPETERRMHAFAEPVALAIASADARSALAASRARIVEAGDAERRRLERNLHDGAQQRLVSVALMIARARARLPHEPEAVAALLKEADAELSEALAELRELAQGLHPALLVDRGLGPAVEALVARAPLPVELAAVPPERLPEPVEAAAYYVTSEALANVAKHAQATSATASIRCSGDRALVEIADDGRGGADAGGGSGLRGLSDRVEALGGRLAIESPPGRGTTVRAELPLTR